MKAYIEFQGVNFTWPCGRQVLADVDLVIGKGETIALLGANGSGKTTLGKLMLGLLKPTWGQVFLAGTPVEHYSLADRGRRIGYVFQNPERQLFAATAAEEIGFALRYQGLPAQEIQERVAEMLALFELGQYATTFPFNLSRGEKQRLVLAAVMALNPEFILLDEPFTGLDWLRKQRLMKVLKRVEAQGVGYLLINHDRDLSSCLCSRVLTLKGGSVR